MTRVSPLLGLGLGVLLVGCAVQLPQRPPPRRPVDPRVSRQFEVDQARPSAPEPAESQEGGESREGEAGAEAGEQEVGEVSPPEALPSGQAVTLEGVLRSVERHFPELVAARQEIEIAEGQLTAALGGFDLKLKGGSKWTQGFYDTTEADLELEQPLPMYGATVRGGYRLGDGNFAVWDGDLETNEFGEFRFGASLPILRGRDIDERRVEVWKARIRRDAADPVVQEKRLRIVQKASQAYWKWLAAGQKVRVARDLLKLAEDRQESLATAVEEGQFGRIILTDNQRLVVVRESLLIAAQRSFENASLLLSLFFRDAEGRPQRTTVEQLPPDFPAFPEVSQEDVDAHVIIGLEQRPELAILGFERSRMSLDLALNENRLLPQFDADVFASQDIGLSSSSKEDKDPFKYGLGLKLQVPLQRRKAKGKIVEVQAKLAKLSQAARLQADRVEAEVRDAASALQRALERLALARRAVELALRMEQAERESLLEGASDLLRLNLREQATAQARSSLIDLEAICFSALANYRAAMGLPEPPSY